MSSVYIDVKMLAGTDIIARGIPDLIALATRLRCSVHCKANDVLIMASPDDNPIDLAVAWEQESNSKKDHKIAVAWQGRQHRVRTAASGPA